MSNALLTKEIIKNKLLTKDTWLLNGVVAIYKNQTSDEQSTGTVKYDNGIGFNGVDAPILTSFAQQIIERKFLSPKQKEIARKKMVKYAGQLLMIAQSK